MNRIVVSLALLTFLASPTFAQHDISHDAMTADALGPAVIAGDLEITGAFSRATLPNAPVGAGYLTITNKGASDDRLVSASSPAAAVTQIHEMKMEGDVMKMNEVEGGLVIPAGGSVALSPGGLHVMFMQLTQQFVEGTTVPLTLTFENAGTVELELAVGAVNADAPAHAHGDH